MVIEKILWCVLGAVIATVGFISMPNSVFPVQQQESKFFSPLPLICSEHDCIAPPP